MAKLEPQDLEFAERAPFVAEGSAVVRGTPEQVWAVLADHERWPEWFGGGVRTVTPTSHPASGVGATRDVALTGSTISERFIAWDEPKLWAFTGTEARPAWLRKLVERCTVLPIDDERCRVTYRMAVELHPALAWLGPVLRVGVSRALAAAMEHLAERVAARAT